MCKMFTKCKLLHYEHRYEQTERENADSREHAEHERTGAERLSALLSDSEPTERSRIIRIASATMSSFRFGDAPSRSMKYASLKIGLSVSRI